MAKKQTLDHALWKELESANPNEETIRKLVTDGANIKNKFLHDVLFQICANYREEDEAYKPLDIKYIKLLVELGADAFWQEDKNDFNLLWNAAECGRPELVDYFIELGLDVNNCSFEDKQSLLEWAEFFEYLKEKDGGQKYPRGKYDAAMWRIIIANLKRHGAKTFRELHVIGKQSKQEIAEEIVREYAYALHSLNVEPIAFLFHPEFKFVYRIAAMGHGIRTDIRYIGHLCKTFIAMRKERLEIKTKFCRVDVDGVIFFSIILLPPHDRRIIFPMDTQLRKDARGYAPTGEVLLLVRVEDGLIKKVECYTLKNYELEGGKVSVVD